jgi:hypothetical protein
MEKFGRTLLLSCSCCSLSLAKMAIKVADPYTAKSASLAGAHVGLTYI